MRVLDAALSTYWAMEEPALRQLLEIVARENSKTPQALEAYRSQALERGEQAKVRDGVAIIEGYGPLVKRASWIAEASGATSYEVMRRDLEAAATDRDVRAILLNLDTPGGAAIGIGELADAVYAYRSIKPIYAYVGGMGASAGYWLASAAERIIINESAIMGSIGVQVALRDTSAAEAKTGIKTMRFVSSQSPEKNADPATDAGAAQLQRTVDSLAAVFVSAVARNRGVSAEHVLARFGRGATEVGAAAVVAGLADEVGTFEGALAMVAAKARERKNFPVSGGVGAKAFPVSSPAAAPLSSNKDFSMPSAQSIPPAFVAARAVLVAEGIAMERARAITAIPTGGSSSPAPAPLSDADAAEVLAAEVMAAGTGREVPRSPALALRLAASSPAPVEHSETELNALVSSIMGAGRCGTIPAAASAPAAEDDVAAFVARVMAAGK